MNHWKQNVDLLTVAELQVVPTRIVFKRTVVEEMPFEISYLLN